MAKRQVEPAIMEALGVVQALRDASALAEELRGTVIRQSQEFRRQARALDRWHGKPVEGAVAAIYGTRCKVIETGCPTCQAWAALDEMKRKR